MKYHYLRLSGFALLLLFFFQSCKDKKEDTVVHISKEEFTIEDQDKIGNHLDNIIQSMPDVFPMLDRNDYADYYEYVETLYRSLINTGQVLRRDSFRWEVHIVKDDEMRTAFMLPGGRLYLYTGLLKMIRAEHELFSIMAHEIHFADRGVMVTYLKAEFGTVLLGDVLLGKDTEEVRRLAAGIKEIVFAPAEIVRADEYAIELVCPFQYNAQGLLSFIEFAENSEEEVLWLHTHPSVDDRLDLLKEKGADCGEEGFTFSERYSFFKNKLP